MTSLRLSAKQQDVVNHNEGAILVVAGPGSGKTRVLTERVKRLLQEIDGHFRVLALTFTNKAANEMRERLDDLDDLDQNAFISTMHGFCLEVLQDRGKSIGVNGLPHIFEQYADRKEILYEAVRNDPLLFNALKNAGDQKAQNKRLDDWLRLITHIKSHPISYKVNDPLEPKILDAYNAGLRACMAYDFDDLLNLTYRLFSEYPPIAGFYRRLYKFICIDEAQDLNEAQYAVLRALCGVEFKNVMMVGDPKQSIYGFNTSSPKYMDMFKADFGAKEVELTDNFRCSKYVVDLATALEPTYIVEGQLPIEGEIKLLVGQNEEHEAQLIADHLNYLFKNGHSDVEGPITPIRCSILGRNKFALLEIEKKLKDSGISYFKRLSSGYQNESEVMEQFQTILKVYANPQDSFHLKAFFDKYELDFSGSTNFETSDHVVACLEEIALSHHEIAPVLAAIKKIHDKTRRFDLLTGLSSLQNYADTLVNEEEKRALYEDITVYRAEWDQYLRSSDKAASLAGFMSGMALGTTQQINKDGVALLTIHSSKGLEFDVVFMAGMADGVFPDFRAKGNSAALQEEKRNAFVAVTRSKRLLFMSYPAVKKMPWGDFKSQYPSAYFKLAETLLSKS